MEQMESLCLENNWTTGKDNKQGHSGVTVCLKPGFCL